MLEKLQQDVEQRLENKLWRAEGAYIKALSAKSPKNCKNCKVRLSDREFSCLIACQGVDAQSAGICFEEKARGCEDFQLRKSIEVLRKQFRSFSMEEISLRWPQIGELLWLQKRIKELSYNHD